MAETNETLNEPGILAISLVRPTPADTEKRCVLKKSCYILKYEFFLGLAHTQKGHFFFGTMNL
jgi:hypothetical protein